jgi:hypothetical protein
VTAGGRSPVETRTWFVATEAAAQDVNDRNFPTRVELALAFLLAMGTRALSIARYLKGQLG